MCSKSILKDLILNFKLIKKSTKLEKFFSLSVTDFFKTYHAFFSKLFYDRPRVIFNFLLIHLKFLMKLL